MMFCIWANRDEWHENPKIAFHLPLFIHEEIKGTYILQKTHAIILDVKKYAKKRIARANFTRGSSRNFCGENHPPLFA